MVREYVRVASVVGLDGSPAPPEISERFQGRLFTKHELEERGVRIAGRDVWYLANGQDWRLTLEPAV
jgi:hypothetical protein